MFFFMFLIFFLSLGFKSRPELAIFSTFQPLSDLCQCLFHEIRNTHTKGWVEESWGSCSNQQIYILYIVQFWTFAFFSKFSREILKLSFYMIFYISIGSKNHIGSAPNFFLIAIMVMNCVIRIYFCFWTNLIAIKKYSFQDNCHHEKKYA